MHHSCLCGSAKNLMFAKPSSQVVGENVFHVPLCRVFFIFNMLKTIWKPIYFIISNIYLISSQFNFNAIQDGIFCGCSRMAGGRGAKMPPSPQNCHTYPTMMKFGIVVPYPKEIQKRYESRDTPLQFCWYQQLFTENQQILLYQEI